MVNVINRPFPYKFKHLNINSSAIFTGVGTINLYVSQSCDKCGYNSVGFYKFIRTPQDFKCRKCLFEWSIACKGGVNSKMDKIEAALYSLDSALGLVSDIAGLSNEK